MKLTISLILILACSCIELDSNTELKQSEIPEEQQEVVVYPDRELVWLVQDHLHSRGYNPGTLNGRLHPATVDAIKAFQYQKGLKVS